jgi:hypothetical protein
MTLSRQFTVAATSLLLCLNVGTPEETTRPNGTKAVTAQPIADHVNDQVNAALAFGSVMDQYLVVYEHEYSPTDHDVYARWVASDGIPLAASFGVATDTTSDGWPAVAYNPGANEFLVVWEHEWSASDHDIYGWRVAAGGGLVGAAHVSTSGTDEGRPRVVYNPVAGEYLVVWEDRTMGSIQARRMAPDGTLLGSQISVSSGAYDEWTPAVAVDVLSGNYLVVWEEETSVAEYDIRGQLLAAGGSPVGGSIAISTWSNDQLQPEVAFASTGNTYLVVWEDHHWGTGSDPDIYGQRVGADGIPIGGHLGVSWDGGNDRLDPAVAYFPAAKEFMVTWEYEYSASDHDVYRRRVATNGGLVEDEVAVAASGYNERVSVHAAAGDLGFLTVWEDDRNGATLGVDIYGGVEQLFMLSGQVFEGDVGDESTPLEGATVELYCSDDEPAVGTFLSNTVSDGEGWYGLVTGATCEYFNIQEIDPEGYISLGATSVGGAVVSDNWIQYTPPLLGKTLTDNKFWDDDTDPAPGSWSGFTPWPWTNDQTPDCTIQVQDEGSGLDPDTAEYSYSTDGGASWSAWLPATCSGSHGSPGPEMITASNVPFGQDSAPSGANQITFSISDLGGNTGHSGTWAVAIDSVPPTSPPAIWSSSHTPGAWSNNDRVNVQWSPGSDGDSGIAGYSVLWDHSPATVPDATFETAGTSWVSDPLADATDWYVHVRTVDVAGNGSEAVHLGPFAIDTVPPSSSVAPLDPWQGDLFIDVSWGGFAGTGSPIVGYDVRVHDGAAVIDWLTDTTLTSLTFTGTRGHTYSFMSRARDAAGNQESYPTVADTVTTVGQDVTVRVRDAAGSPRPGAKVYSHGDLVGFTNGAGTVTAPDALLGDELIALDQVHEEPAVKPYHGNHGSGNWAWRAYQSSLSLDPTGTPMPDLITNLATTQELTVSPDLPLIGVHMLVSVEFDADAAFLADLAQGLEISSELLYDVTDGQFFWEVIELADDAHHWMGCDMQIHASNVGRANAHRGGISLAEHAHINIRRYDDRVTNSWSVGDGHRVLVHEFGHYGFHLWDEYLDRDGLTRSFCASNFLTPLPESRASIMHEHVTATELCSRVDPSHTHRTQTQHDAQTNGESTWETVQRMYSDATSPPRWVISTPDDRGAVMPGPVALPIASWSEVYVTDFDTGACAPFSQTFLYAATGTPVAQGRVLVDRPHPLPDLPQGVTDGNGQVVIVGAHDGDILRIQKDAAGGSFPISCSSAAKSRGDPLYVEELPFALSAEVSALGANSVRIQVAASVPLAAEPEVELWQQGAAAPQSVTMSFDSGFGLYTGQAILDGALEAAGYVSVTATDLSANTVTVHQRFALHQVIAAVGSAQFYSDDGNLELVLQPGCLSQDAVVSIASTATGTAGQGTLQRVGTAYRVQLSAGSLTCPAGLIARFSAQSVDGLEPESLDLYRWDETAGQWSPLGGSLDEDHHLVSAWTSELGVFALFGSTVAIFADDFESGSTSAWSETVP